LLAAIDPVNQIGRLQPVTNDLPSPGFRFGRDFSKISRPLGGHRSRPRQGKFFLPLDDLKTC
jgi:hypothetical protein